MMVLAESCSSLPIEVVVLTPTLVVSSLNFSMMSVFTSNLFMSTIGVHPSFGSDCMTLQFLDSLFGLTSISVSSIDGEVHDIVISFVALDTGQVSGPEDSCTLPGVLGSFCGLVTSQEVILLAVTLVFLLLQT